MKTAVQFTTTNKIPRSEITVEIDSTALRIAHTNMGARVYVEDWLSAGRVGGPGLPAKPIGVALPPGYQPKDLQVKATEQIKVTDKPTRLAPLRQPRRDVPDGTPYERPGVLRVAAHYRREQKSPRPLAHLVETRRIGDTSVAVIQINPVFFNPDRSLGLATKLALTLNLKKSPKGGKVKGGGPLQPTSDSQMARLAQLARASVMNPEQVVEPSPLPLHPRHGATGWDYLVITDNNTWDTANKRVLAPINPGLADAFTPLVNWKNQLGLQARVVTVGDIVQSSATTGFGVDFVTDSSDLQAVIRKFLRWAHEHWGTAYVLLGSDQSIVPIRQIQNGSGSHPSLPTDFYYADLDSSCDWVEGQQVDLFAVNYQCDIGVGRAPATSREQADTFVNKVIGYEQWYCDPSAPSTEWLHRILFAATKWGGDDPTHIARAAAFPPGDDQYYHAPQSAYTTIKLQEVVNITRSPNTSGNPNMNCFIEVAGTSYFKIQMAPTNREVQDLHVQTADGSFLLQHTDQASATTPGWYYTDWLDYDGPCHNDQGENYPTKWLIVYLASNQQPPQSFYAQLCKVLRLDCSLISKVAAGDFRPIPYDAGASSARHGWYFAKGAQDPTPSPVAIVTGDQLATAWITVYADPAELEPAEFLLDPSEEADTMVEQERLRKTIKKEIPAWDQVSRLYPDVIDLPSADRYSPEVQYYSRDRLRDELNEGQHIVSIAGHGNEWATCCGGEGGDFTTSLADQLTNQPRWGIFYANSCLTNRYTAESLSRHLVLENRNGGAVAYVGFMDEVQIGLGHAVQNKFFTDLSNTRSLGIAFDARVGLLSPGSAFDANDRFVRQTIIMMNLLGDPALKVYGPALHHCLIGPTSGPCPVAPICPVAPAQTCPAVPFIECKPGPAVLKCPPAVTVLRCPPAPKECHTAPVEACPAGPQQGWEDPRDWIDPVFKYRYVEGIGHTLVLVRKSQLPARGPVDAAEAAEYGYGPEYWNQNATASKMAGETPAAKDESQPSGEFKPTARKRGK